MARDKAQLLEMGERIRQLRKARGYKQQWIADQCGVQLRTYQFWQAGHSPPSQESLEKLAELFGVSQSYILRGETPEPFAIGETPSLLAIQKQLAAIQDQLEALKIDTEAHALEVLRRLDEGLPPRAASQ